jgi:hypothetical protein
MRDRHNTILERPVAFTRKDGADVFVVCAVNETIRGSGIIHKADKTGHEQAISPDLRPDILLHNPSTGSTVVADVTIPYKARSEKEQEISRTVGATT